MAASELVLGIGCRRGTPYDVLTRGVDSVLAAHGLAPARVRAIASVEHKADERGLNELSVRRGWPITFYAARELGEGVCEPAARRYAGHPALLVSKQVYRHPDLPGAMTLAVAELSP